MSRTNNRPPPLVGLLRERLGSAWREAWLAQGVPGVARALLPIALADDPAAALGELQAQMQHALDELHERDPETFAQPSASIRQSMSATAPQPIRCGSSNAPIRLKCSGTNPKRRASLIWLRHPRRPC